MADTEILQELWKYNTERKSGEEKINHYANMYANEIMNGEGENIKNVLSAPEVSMPKVEKKKTSFIKKLINLFTNAENTYL